MQTVNDIVRTYLKNRAEFYRALLPRVPHTELRRLLAEAAGPADTEEQIEGILRTIPMRDPEEFLWTLALKDVFKKPAFGQAWGKTTISFEEALARCEQMEEAGVMLFSELLRMYPQASAELNGEARQRKAALMAMLQLDDELRYHKRRV